MENEGRTLQQVLSEYQIWEGKVFRSLNSGRRTCSGDPHETLDWVHIEYVFYEKGLILRTGSLAISVSKITLF